MIYLIFWNTFHNDSMYVFEWIEMFLFCFLIILTDSFALCCFLWSQTMCGNSSPIWSRQDIERCKKSLMFVKERETEISRLNEMRVRIICQLIFV